MALISALPLDLEPTAAKTTFGTLGEAQARCAKKNKAET
jgi:hypothetical protein